MLARRFIFFQIATVVFLRMVCGAEFGPGSSGGGDICEDRIVTIRDDIKLWIRRGGPKELRLPPGLTSDQYSKAMLAQIVLAKVRCVGPSDEGYPVFIGKIPKTCRFDNDKNNQFITCDANKFQQLNESDQYVLIHHELAGLGRLEPPKGDDSNYHLSNQISDFLTDQVVKKLAVKPIDSEVSILDKVLNPKKNLGQNQRRVLAIDIERRIKANEDGGFFASGLIQFEGKSPDIYGHKGYLLLKEALADLSAWLDIALFHPSVEPRTEDYQKMFLKDVRLFSLSPKTATGLADSEIEQLDLRFHQRANQKRDTLLHFTFRGGKVIVKSCSRKCAESALILASGRTFAEAFEAALNNLKD